MKHLALLVLLFPLSATAKFDHKTIDENDVFKTLKEYVRQTERPFLVFHWENRDREFEKKFDLKTQSGLIAMLKESSESYLKTKGAYGFYAANDPVVSRKFGDSFTNKWRLIQIQVPKGLTYLDTDHRKLHEALQSKLKDEACARHFLVVLNIDKGARSSVPEECAKLKKKLFTKLGISAVQYHYMQPPKIPGCKGQNRSGFILLNSSWLTAENVKQFVAESKENLEERSHLQWLLRNSVSADLEKRPSARDLWSDVPTSAKAITAAKQWAQENLLNCSPALKASIESPKEGNEPDQGPAY